MTERHSRFPYWLIVLGFPLFGGLFLGVAITWSWATGWNRPPDPLAVPVEFFVNNLAEPLGLVRYADSGNHWGFLLVLGALWEASLVGVGIGVALLAWLVDLLVPRGKGEGR